MVLPELDVKYIQKWCALKEHSRHVAYYYELFAL